MNNISISSKLERLRIILNTLVDFNDEALFDFTTEGILISCVDKERSAYVFFEVSKSFFLEYTISESEKIKILITQLNSVINHCSANISIEFTNLVKIKSQSTYVIEARLPIILGEETIPIIKKIDYDMTLCLSIGDFKSILDNLMTFSNFVEVNVSKASNHVTITSTEAGGSDMTIGLPIISDKTIIANDLNLSFNAKNIKALLQHLPDQEQIYLSLHRDEPVKIYYSQENFKINLYSALVQT